MIIVIINNRYRQTIRQCVRDRTCELREDHGQGHRPEFSRYSSMYFIFSSIYSQGIFRCFLIDYGRIKEIRKHRLNFSFLFSSDQNF